MNTDYCLSRRLFEWFRRIRHRCGYGVHSPFAFNLVTGVIYCRDEYYAYAPLSRQRKAWQGLLSEKDERLLFRLANAQKADRIGMVGTADRRVEAYLRAARPHARQTVYASPVSLSELIATCDFVYCSDFLQDCISADDFFLSNPVAVSSPALIVCRSPHRNAASRKLWKALCHAPSAVVTFDLYRFGLIYLYPNLNKQHYVINYF